MRENKTKEELQAAARERQARFRAQTIKLQIHFPLRLIKKLDRECDLKQERRGDVVRRLVDSLPD